MVLLVSTKKKLATVVEQTTGKRELGSGDDFWLVLIYFPRNLHANSEGCNGSQFFCREVSLATFGSSSSNEDATFRLKKPQVS